MRYPTVFLFAMALPASATAHVGPHAGMSLVESIEHLLGPQHVIGLAGAVAAAAVLAFGGLRRDRDTRRSKSSGKERRP
jgi:hypothetical protein